MKRIAYAEEITRYQNALEWIAEKGHSIGNLEGGGFCVLRATVLNDPFNGDTHASYDDIGEGTTPLEAIEAAMKEANDT
jgi:hypothetical protein